MSRRRDTTLAEALGLILLYLVLSFALDTMLSWFFELAANADFHTHYGVFSLFWMVVVGNIWLCMNVGAVVRQIKK